MKKIYRKVTNLWRTWRQHANEPLRIEFVLTDWCNLNCKGCTHYSPLAAKEFEPLEQLEANAAHLGHVAADIPVVYLIGGETLLYPRINEAMRIVRKAFPDARLHVFTNGLALPRMSDEFWQTARDCGIIMSITRYPIKFDYDAAEELCRSNGVEVDVFGDRSEDGSFFRFALDPTGSQNGRLNHFRCFNRGCVSIIGDRIYPCSISACVDHLNKACGTNFEHRDGDYMLVKDIRSSADIRRLRDRTVPFCRYCKPHPQSVPYGPSKRHVGEWVD